MTPNEYAAAIDSLTVQLELLKQEAFPEHAKLRFQRGICLVCKEPIGNKRPIRGCDPNCYQKIKRGIESGVYSEGHAIASGLLTPEQKSGRKSASVEALAELFQSIKTASQVESAAEIDEEKPVIQDVGRKKKPPVPAVKSTTKSATNRKTGT